MARKWVWVFIVMAGLAVAQQQSVDGSTGKPAPRQRIRVTSRVVQGLVLKKVVPDAADFKSLKNSNVKIAFEIDEAGAVESAKAIEGDPALYDRSVKAIREWRFKPYLLDGHPIVVESYVYFHFNKGKASVLFPN